MIKGLLLPIYSRHGLGTTCCAILFLASIGQAICAPPAPTPSATILPSQPRYYFNIDLDPRYQIVGVGALTETTAALANCYYFTYDNSGKLQRIEYKRAGAPCPDPFFQATRIDFEYQAGVERRWYRDEKGHPVRNVSGIFGEKLTLNAAGYPTDVTNLDESDARMRDASGVIHYVRQLDEQGRLILGRRIGLLGTAITDSNGLFETRTIYDEQGRRIEYGNYDSSGNPLNDNDGVALTRTTYTIYPDSILSSESYFDASGLATEKKSSGVHDSQCTLDNRGLMLDESCFDATGAPTLESGREIHESRRIYDDRGNLLSEAFFDADGKPKNQKPAGYARVVYKYDNKNRVSEKSYFGDDGTPQVLLSLGAAVIKQEYDDQGNLVRRQFFDGQGNPSPHLQYGAPAIRIKVEGDTTTISLRNADDKLMENPVEGYAIFSYKTATDTPLSPTNQYFDRHGRKIYYFPRVSVINPHLHALRTNIVMQLSARCGAGAVGLGSLLAAFLALRKSSHTRRRRVYVPTPLERLLGWFSIFAILEGTLRFFMTIYWAWVGYQNGHMGHGVYVLETIFILFFLYRLVRLSLTMRVLNIGRDDLHRLIRDFFTKAHLEPQWVETRKMFVTKALSVRVRYFEQKYHAYLTFLRKHRAGRDLARGLAQYLRAHVGDIQSPPTRRIIAIYYPSVAFCYFLLAGTAFYTLWQLVKR